MSCLKELKDQFYFYYTKKITLRDFESWLYQFPGLEADIGKDFYFQLIDIDYRDKTAGKRLEKVMFYRFPPMEFEERRIRELLEKVVEGKSLPKVLEQLYDEYCKGYHFLDLGLAYVNFLSCEDVNKEKLSKEARQILRLMDQGQIVITNLYEYRCVEKEQSEDRKLKTHQGSSPYS